MRGNTCGVGHKNGFMVSSGVKQGEVWMGMKFLADAAEAGVHSSIRLVIRLINVSPGIKNPRFPGGESLKSAYRDVPPGSAADLSLLYPFIAASLRHRIPTTLPCARDRDHALGGEPWIRRVTSRRDGFGKKKKICARSITGNQPAGATSDHVFVDHVSDWLNSRSGI